MPAEPWANVENSRRTTSETTRCAAPAASPERVAPSALSSGLEFYDPTPQSDHRGVGAVVGVQFGEDAFDSSLHGFFGDRELIRDLLVGKPFGDQTEDADFGRGQRVIGDMESPQAMSARTTARMRTNSTFLSRPMRALFFSRRSTFDVK